MQSRVNRQMRPDIRSATGPAPEEHVAHLVELYNMVGGLTAKGPDGETVHLFTDFFPPRRAIVVPLGITTSPTTVYRIGVNRVQKYPSRMNVMQQRWDQYVYIRCGGIYPFFVIDHAKWLDPAGGNFVSCQDQRHVEFICALKWISEKMGNSAGREAIVRGGQLLDEVNEMRIKLRAERGTTAPQLPIAHMIAVGYLLVELGPELTFTDQWVARCLSCTVMALYRHRDMYKELRDSYVGGGKQKRYTEYPPAPATDIWVE